MLIRVCYYMLKAAGTLGWLHLEVFGSVEILFFRRVIG